MSPSVFLPSFFTQLWKCLSLYLLPQLPTIGRLFAQVQNISRTISTNDRVGRYHCHFVYPGTRPISTFCFSILVVPLFIGRLKAKKFSGADIRDGYLLIYIPQTGRFLNGSNCVEQNADGFTTCETPFFSYFSLMLSVPFH